MTGGAPDDRAAAERLAALEASIEVCGRCPELRAYTAEIARLKRRAYAAETYWGRPVPGFGAADARCVLVGLAPGAHGSNRTGRMFTGDASGEWLYRALFRAGLATQPNATGRGDGLRLIDTFVTAALRCAPPDNKPTPQQLVRCAPHLDAELALLSRARVVVGLGAIGTKAAVSALRRAGLAVPSLPFAHGARCEVFLPAKVRATPCMERDESKTLTLIASYHPSRQNTNTGKLTEAMFDTIFTSVRSLLDTSVP